MPCRSFHQILGLLLNYIMRWADRVQSGVEGAKKVRNLQLGNPGMILALLMLVLAVILSQARLHWKLSCGLVACGIGI